MQATSGAYQQVAVTLQCSLLNALSGLTLHLYAVYKRSPGNITSFRVCSITLKTPKKVTRESSKGLALSYENMNYRKRNIFSGVHAVMLNEPLIQLSKPRITDKENNEKIEDESF